MDVIIPTYNRAGLLRRTLDSCIQAEIPPGLQVVITAVDNNSSDDTAAVIHEYELTHPGRVRYLKEQYQGKSYSLNAGIRAAAGELVGMIDDDEEIDPQWYRIAYDTFQNPATDFLGGPAIPEWETAPPVWLHPRMGGAVGWIEFGDEIRAFGADWEAYLLGGNAVVRRVWLERVGLYNTQLGPARWRLLDGEDEEIYQRLIRSGAHGVYHPDLRIFHWIPAERLKKRFLRKRQFWSGVSMGWLDRIEPLGGVRIFGIPRYLYREPARAPGRYLKACLAGNPAERFYQELFWWRLAGIIAGRFFLAPPAESMK